MASRTDLSCSRYINATTPMLTISVSKNTLSIRMSLDLVSAASGRHLRRSAVPYSVLRDFGRTSDQVWGAYQDRPGLVREAGGRADGNPSEGPPARYERRLRGPAVSAENAETISASG